MGLSFTRDQQYAIDFEGKDTLVSAAAGSGKTAVLSERVLRKLKEGVSLDALVILTFTNKAAAEMKERIRKKITAEPGLSHELEKIDAAHIRTFDSYALYLLKRYGHERNISRRVSILDETDGAMIKDALMESVFLSFFEKADERFKAFLSRYTTRDDVMLKRNMLYFYDKMTYFEDKQGFEEKMRNTYFTHEHFEELFARYETDVLSSVQRFYKTIRRLAKHDFKHPKIIDYMDELLETFAPLESVRSYEDAHRFFAAEPKFPRLPGGRKGDDPELDEEKAFVKVFRDNRLQKTYDALKGKSDRKGDVEDTKEEHYDAYMSLQSHIDVIMDVLGTFEQAYYEKQRDIERFDYASVARIVLSILQDNDALRSELSESVNEIMVDEYQDTNALQEAFLNLIKRNNLYMVGDVKQSIYRFRNAEPAIFARKYVHFKKTGEGEAIDLNLNFRSRKPVLDDINAVFECVMDHEIGGIDYDHKQALRFGNKSYSAHEDGATPYGITIHNYEVARYEETYGYDFTRKEAELMHMAKTIKEAVESGAHKVLDAGALRPSRYGDYAILLDRSTSFDDARKIFEYVGVPLLVHKNVTFTDYPEVMLIRQLMTFVLSLRDADVYAKHFKHAFMSVMRSFIGVSDDDALINQTLDLPKRLTGKNALMANVSEPFVPYFEKAYDVLSIVEHGTLYDAVRAILETFSLYENVVRIPDSEGAVVRIDYLLELSRVKMAEGYDLKRFIEYFRYISENDLRVELSLRSDFSPDKVNLMTMHKSKGLEFPFVFIGHLDNPFHNVMENNVLIEEELGILLPHEKEGDDKHFLYSLFRNSETAKDVSERLRLLYVALSRAEEGVHIVYGETGEERSPSGLVDINIRRHFRTFHDVFEAVMGRFSDKKRTLDIAKYQEDIDYANVLKTRGIDVSSATEKTYEAIPEAPHPQDERSFSSGIADILDAYSLDAIDKGNLLHDTLEALDFFAPIEPQLDHFDLSDDDREIIKAFFDTDLMRRLDIRSVHKEYPFAYESDGSRVSGYIDLLLHTSEGYVVIDYKLKDIDKPHYETQVRGYIDTLEQLTSEPVSGYLYSILDNRFKRVDKE